MPDWVRPELREAYEAKGIAQLYSHQAATAELVHGDVLVRSQVVGFKKIKFFTNENIGAGKLELPENEMHTTSFWVTLNHELLQSLPFSLSDRQSGIFGLLHALASVATLLLMCDRGDLGTAIGERMASTCRSSQALAGTPHVLPIPVHSTCCCRMLHRKSETRANGSFSIQRLRGFPAVRGLTLFWLVSRGGRVAGSRSSSYLCASTAKNVPCRRSPFGHPVTARSCRQ